MSVVLREKITGPAAWKGSELATSTDWISPLSERLLTALDAALQGVKRRGLGLGQFTREDFPLDGCEETLAAFADELENGRGFLVLRGLPADRYGEVDMTLLYYGLGLHLGTPVLQNPAGDLLGRVANVGDLADKRTRVYETNAYLPYHTDLSDVVGLLCIRKAKSGGLSSLVAAGAIYNEIVAHHPEFLGLFYRPLYFDHLGEELPSLSPIFSFHEGKLSCRYLRQYIELGQELRGLPISRVETEALDLFDSIIHDPRLRLDMMLEPGDMQFANNYAVLHSRTGFEDDEDPARRRLLYRLWLKMPNARRLAPDFPGRNGFPPR